MSQPRPVFLTLLLVSLVALPVGLTWAQTEKNKAQKFDEFGDIYLSDIKARLDNFAIQLQNEPSAKGFIIVYRSRRDLPGLNHRYLHQMQEYLINSRGVAPDRIAGVDGGEANCLAQELWIVPPGTAPTPRPDAYKRYFDDFDSPRKFDELWLESADGPDTVSAVMLEAYATALRAEPQARAYIIAYPSYYVRRDSYEEDGKVQRSVETHRDPPGTAGRTLAAARTLLIKEFHISVARIRLRDGGYRKESSLELWIVPKGEHLPVPTPNSFPPKYKRAK